FGGEIPARRSRKSWICAASMFALAPATNAAAPATCGAAADVPKNGFRDPRFELTSSNPVTSGLTRESMVGPCELNGSRLLAFCTSAAPTASAYGELAGSVTLPDAALDGFTNERKLFVTSPQ